MKENMSVTKSNAVLESSKKSRKKGIAVIVSVAVIVITLMALLAGGIVLLLWQKSNALNEFDSELEGVRTIGTVGENVRKEAQAELFDPFENLIVTYSGISSYGNVWLKKKDCTGVYENIQFSVDKNLNVSNGDVITVTFGADMDPVAYCVENYGMCPSVTSKEYTVEGLDVYVSTLSQITPEAENAMIEDGRRQFMLYVLGYWSKGYTVDDFTLMGYCFAHPKEGTGEYHPQFYAVYKVNATWQYFDPLWRERFAMQPVEFYYLIECSVPHIDPDGNCVTDMEYPYVPYHEIGFTAGRESLSGEVREQTMSTIGYYTLEDVFAAVETEPHLYTYETNIPRE